MIAKIQRLLADKERVIVAIDGMAASGKTTLAGELDRIFSATVIHMDDFFLPTELRTAERYAQIGGNVHYERFIDEVLKPLQGHDMLAFRRFDCHSMAYSIVEPFYPKQLIIVEGAYALHPKFGRYYDMPIVLRIEADEQKKRILARNGTDGWKNFEQRWIPMENAYLSELRSPQTVK